MLTIGSRISLADDGAGCCQMMLMLDEPTDKLDAHLKCLDTSKFALADVDVGCPNMPNVVDAKHGSKLQDFVSVLGHGGG